MTNVAYFDDVITVTAAISPDGQTSPKTFTWQGRHYSMTIVGRQWESEDGRHILVESAGGDRFELQLSRADLLWHLKRVWSGESLA
jgi:hypothetical protein